MSDRPVKPHFNVFELYKTVWEVPMCYGDLSLIGWGFYGDSALASYLPKTGARVAIKKLARPFQTVTHAKRAYREVRLLTHMHHENVISLLDAFTPTTRFTDFQDVYLVTYLTGAYLSNNTQELTEDHVKFLIYQLLRGLKYIHSAGITHLDLKPSNIAINASCELKILDFGLARLPNDKMAGCVAQYYRAPEIMLNGIHYNQTVDIWSVGCIMAEMMTKRTLFPGICHIDQLTRIMKVVGSPGEAFLSRITSEDARQCLQNLPRMERQNFSEYFASAHPQAVDILERMLDLDPSTRITATEALAHRYVEQYADPEDEPTAEPFDEAFENKELNTEQWRKLLYEEIEQFSEQFSAHSALEALWLLG